MLLAPKIKLVESAELNLLGAPILESAGEKWAAERLVDLKRMIKRLENIDSHDSFFLLKNCLQLIY